MKYCESIYQTIRRPTREVMVGNVGVGGSNPVRIQSMTTSDTRDAAATIDQIAKLADYGCEIARVTVQGMKEADTCEEIKNGLLQRGLDIPLVADIHFFPPAAMRVVDFVDKVRINPGNYLDKRATFKTLEYDDLSYALELEKIEEKFSPLVEKCKLLKRSMRIGTNHGSLSDRIMNRYGDTPEGMVESALEFARVCRKLGYHDFMFSMKSSNPKVMILAYRLLVAEMYRLGWDYPLHLGVTEAGAGEDGRIKSAMGIGALLLDGIGDTIRVSLTEDAWHEIDPCRRLVDFAAHFQGRGVEPFEETRRFQPRAVAMPKNLSLHRDGSVVLSVSKEEIDAPDFYRQIGCKVTLGEPKLDRNSADLLLVENGVVHQKLNKLRAIGIHAITPIPLEQASFASRFAIPLSQEPVVVEIFEEADFEKLSQVKPDLILLSCGLHPARRFFEGMRENGLAIPVILKFTCDQGPEDRVIQIAAEGGALLCDGLGDGICLQGALSLEEKRQFSFNLLQAARMRTSKTEFISCPSCGRTLFDLQDVSKRIRSQTAHLPGVKIAIMGCIVNGPGEMADADFGYVGSRPGMIDLYVGKERVEKNIPFDQADSRLIELIKAHGRWEEPNSQEAG